MRYRKKIEGKRYQLDLSLDFQTAVELEEMSELHLWVLRSVGKSDFQSVSLSARQLELP
jgi:hypothetical protein